MRDEPALAGMTGQQAQGDVNYRLTRKTTVGAYYSFSHYLYPHGFGNSDTNTVGLIYSYAFTRTMQLRLRGAAFGVQSLGLRDGADNPLIAALLGRDRRLSTSYAKRQNERYLGSVRQGLSAAARQPRWLMRSGISPGNGIYQTSQQESISANLTDARFFGRYSLTVRSRARHSDVGERSRSGTSGTVSRANTRRISLERDLPAGSWLESFGGVPAFRSAISLAITAKSVADHLRRHMGLRHGQPVAVSRRHCGAKSDTLVKTSRRYRLTVRTEPSQGLNTGSIPVSATKSLKINHLQNRRTRPMYKQYNGLRGNGRVSPLSPPLWKMRCTHP